MLNKARKLFEAEGLIFLYIQDDLTNKLKEVDYWVFATRDVEDSPYGIEAYIDEADSEEVGEYAIIAHSGHGWNSYALQYYLIYDKLEMFLHLAWGGVYMDHELTTKHANKCFMKASRIIELVQQSDKIPDFLRLRVIVSDYYGSDWYFVSSIDPEEMDNKNGFSNDIDNVEDALKEYDEYDDSDKSYLPSIIVLNRVINWLKKRCCPYAGERIHCVKY